MDLQGIGISLARCGRRLMHLKYDLVTRHGGLAPSWGRVGRTKDDERALVVTGMTFTKDVGTDYRRSSETQKAIIRHLHRHLEIVKQSLVSSRLRILWRSRASSTIPALQSNTHRTIDIPPSYPLYVVHILHNFEL